MFDRAFLHRLLLKPSQYEKKEGQRVVGDALPSGGRDPSTDSLCDSKESPQATQELGASLASCKMNGVLSGSFFPSCECELDGQRRGGLWPTGPNNVNIGSKFKLNKCKYYKGKESRGCAVIVCMLLFNLFVRSVTWNTLAQRVQFN